MKYILQSGNDPQLGGKAYSLAQLQAEGFDVPEWFAVAPRAFEDSLSDSQRSALRRGHSEEIRSALNDIVVSPSVVSEIATALKNLPCDSGKYAVRSSAADEDSLDHSFAGQLESYLCVPADEVPEKVAAVWRSGFSERVLGYRTAKGGIGFPTSAPAVVVQRMVHANSAGVAFSADPVSGRRGVAVISAVWGLGRALVSGECDADVYEVDRFGKITRALSSASRVTQGELCPNPKGASRRTLAKDARVLTDQEVLRIAAVVRQVTRRLGPPQDIEWAIENGRLYVLQARPITTLRTLADPDAVRNIWDNSNITESYSGITTPLTFSFALAAYESVYRELAHILKVGPRKIAAHEQTFHHMLGLIRGRVYYNLLNWYRVLALLPGFKVNRQFMEQMMGVKEALPDEVAAGLVQANFRERVLDTWRLCRMFAALVENYFTLGRTTERFYTRLNHALVEPVPALAEMRIDELAGYYRDLMRQVLTHWDAPLLNDLYTMIFHGSLRKLSARWIGGGDELTNELVRGQGGMISLEPAIRLCEMAETVASHPELLQVLQTRDAAASVGAIRRIPRLSRKYDEYLAKFGERCLEELKLESPTLHDDPWPLLSSLAQLAQGTRTAATLSPATLSTCTAEQRVNQALVRHPLRRVVFKSVLRNARERIRGRENLRFERTRVFGRVRRVFLEIGRRMHELALLDNPRDIFYLQVEEVLGFVSGTAVTPSLKELVALRKREWEEIRRQPAPADRFETYGPVYHGHTFQSEKNVQDGASLGEERQGLGSCPGRVRGRVFVVRDPHVASLPAGGILVAERTDPGWITLFATAAGLIVERGSLLSHSAIVSRELGIPSVVSIPGITQWLCDGDVVELDGGKGTVRRLRSESAHA